MPLAIGVGRRIVILGSTAILVAGAILCATAKSYEWHLGARILVGLAAGQSESIVPMITQVTDADPMSICCIRTNIKSR
jgi:predicted MFS family arabinose efflux permease